MPVWPFAFALVDASDTTFGPSHYREDFKVFSMSGEGEEGDAFSLTLRILNPGGLLQPGRKHWLWVAWRDPDSLVITPIFFGQIVAIPSDLFGRVIEINAVARAADHFARLVALAQTLKVQPNYDPILIAQDRQNDPLAVLEGYSGRIAIDRTNLAVT